MLYNINMYNDSIKWIHLNEKNGIISHFFSTLSYISVPAKPFDILTFGKQLNRLLHQDTNTYFEENFKLDIYTSFSIFK
jgi:hypothetical protein